jgi:hypothetical protein
MIGGRRRMQKHRAPHDVRHNPTIFRVVGRSLSPLSLDFLGFSRPNHNLSKGYTE